MTVEDTQFVHMVSQSMNPFSTETAFKILDRRECSFRVARFSPVISGSANRRNSWFRGLLTSQITEFNYL